MSKPAPRTALLAPAAALLMLAVFPLAGCRLIAAPFLAWGQEQTKPVPAEYPYLAGRKICILVWAEQFTLFEYPHVQLDVSEHVRVALEGAVQGLTVIPNRQVVDYQTRDPNWETRGPARIGARFGADRVLMIELTQYTTREPGSPHLYRGYMGANIKVYDTGSPDAEPAYKTTLETVYPPDSMGTYGTDDRTIRASLMRAFGAELAGKFHDRREKVK